MPIHIENYNVRLVQQDDKLRERCLSVTRDVSPGEAVMLDCLLAIHERLGNMMILMIQTGGH